MGAKMTVNPLTLKSLTLAILLNASLGLAGCGSPDDPSADNPDSGEAAKAAEAEKLAEAEASKKRQQQLESSPAFKCDWIYILNDGEEWAKIMSVEGGQFNEKDVGMTIESDRYVYGDYTSSNGIGYSTATSVTLNRITGTLSYYYGEIPVEHQCEKISGAEFLKFAQRQREKIEAEKSQKEKKDAELRQF